MWSTMTNIRYGCVELWSVGLIGSICETLCFQPDTSEMSKTSSCEGHTIKAHCGGHLSCAQKILFVTVVHTHNSDGTYGPGVPLFAKCAKCASSGLPQALSVLAPRPSKGTAAPPTHAPTHQRSHLQLHISRMHLTTSLPCFLFRKS